MQKNRYEMLGGVTPSEITPESLYLSRRNFMKTGVAASLAGFTTIAQGSPFNTSQDEDAPNASNTASIKHAPTWLRTQVNAAKPSPHKNKSEQGEELTPSTVASNYNNYYEFGYDKSDPKTHGSQYRPTAPWSITVDGECDKPGTYMLEDLLKSKHLQERIYRLRCVEAWSMVLPWIGVPLNTVLQQLQPNSKAKFVAFETVQDKEQMPGQSSYFSTIDWPYTEGLRIDEAMHDLAFLAVGLYGKPLPGQNGAPIRLVVPWKYGFKSVKSISRIQFTQYQPPTTWNQLQPKEYGFYANVVPYVSHPRWTQSRERRLPSSFFNPNWRETQLFNGYSTEVASLYKNMNLSQNF